MQWELTRVVRIVREIGMRTDNLDGGTKEGSRWCNNLREICVGLNLASFANLSLGVDIIRAHPGRWYRAGRGRNTRAGVVVIDG